MFKDIKRSSAALLSCRLQEGKSRNDSRKGEVTIRRSTVWLTILVLFTLGTFGLSSLSSVPVSITRIWKHSDWILHGIEYGLLAWCMLMYLHEVRFTARQTIAAYIGSFLFSGIIGGLNELWQAHVPHRSPSGSDVVSNLIGATLFIGLFHLVKMKKVTAVS